MPILELCAGVGALGLVAEHITSEQVRYVAEIDPAASAVLAKHYPDAPNLGDITEIDWTALIGEVDIITSGFPCQGISNAGLRKGLEDERSGLWYTVLEAIRVLRPRVVFLENVSAIARRGLAEVVAGLSQAGYDARWSCIRASDIGAAHHRDRWFCIAVPKDADGESWDQWRSATPRQAQGPCTSRFCGGGGGGGQSAASRSQPHGATLADEVCFLLPYSDSLRRDGRTGALAESSGRDESSDSRYSPPAWWGAYHPVIHRWESLFGFAAPAPTEKGPRGGIRVTARFAEWLMGFVPGWVTDVPGLTRGQQLKAIGNAVQPQQAYAAFTSLLDYQEDD